MKAQSVGARLGVRRRCLRVGLVLGTLLFLGAGLLLPQSNPDVGKDKAPAKPPEAKSDPPAKNVEPAKPAPPPVREVILSEEKYQELLDRENKYLERIKQLEKQLKAERQPVDNCWLTGELKDNDIVFEAAFTFTTNFPNMVVALGLQRGFLIDPKGLDHQKLAENGLALRAEDDGYVLNVARPGLYKEITLHLKVPVSLRRSGDKGGSDRGFKLGLPPGASATELSLKLPDEIKELRWKNGAADEAKEPRLEKTRQDGRWQFTVGSGKLLDLVWKERDAATPPQANITINVKLEEASSVTTADMQLEDPRGEAKEWQLFLPFHPDEVKIVKPPTGVTCKLFKPSADSKNQLYIVSLEPTSEPFIVRAEVRTRKEAANLLVGPFYAQIPGSAVAQQGKIIVQTSAGGARGQFLDFKPSEWVHRSEIPKGPAWQDVRAVFDFGNFPAQLKENPKIPLEIKWRADKGAGEVSVDHQLKMRLRPGNLGLQVDVDTQIKIKSLSGGDYLDVQLPRPSPPKLGFLAVFPAAGFPGGLPLGGLAEQFPTDPALAEPVGSFSLALDEDGSVAKMSDPDGLGKARIKFAGPVNKEVTQTLRGRYYVPMTAGDLQRFRIDLPRPLGIVERSGKVSVSSSTDEIELLMGPPSVEFKTDWDSSFPPLDLSWRPYHPQFLVQNVADVTLQRGKEAHLHQQLTLKTTPKPGGPEVPMTGVVALRVPRNARGSVKVSGGGEEINRMSDPEIVWVQLTTTDKDKPLEVDFYQPLPEAPQDHWKVPLVVPEKATAVEARVRVWSDAGVQPEALKQGENWQDRGREIVPGRPLPALVLSGSGSALDLTLRLTAAGGVNLPIMVCDRGLVEATVDEDGNHRYRARYFIKLRTNQLSIRFPAPALTCIQKVTLGTHEVSPQQDPTDRNVALLKIEPEILRALTEGKGQGAGLMLIIDYDVPASFAENDTRWQTTLTGPVFLGDVFLGRVRWLVNLPGNWVSVVAANNVHPDYRWTLQKYMLAPEALVSAAELAEWRRGPNDLVREDPSLVFSRSSQEPFVVVHFPQPTWLALCSGLLLAVGLALHMLPISRSFFWVVLTALVAGMIAGGFLWPAWVPALLFGAQPGAVVLGLFLAIQWVLKERYRRQVIFMPGFTRLKPGSSLLHNPPAARPREASTVDAPAPVGRGSSAQKNSPS